MEHVRPNVVRFVQSKICFKAGDSILVIMKAIASHGWKSPSEDFEVGISREVIITQERETDYKKW